MPVFIENQWITNNCWLKMGLDDKRNAYITKLSGGQKQRVFLALAIVNDPQFLFLDDKDASQAISLLSNSHLERVDSGHATHLENLEYLIRILVPFSNELLETGK